MKAMNMQLILLFSVCWSLSYALYFHTGEREEKCLIEDIPSDTLITGRYKIQQWDINQHDFLPSAPGLGLVLTIKAPNGEILLSKVYGPEGKFTFTSHSPGEHNICVQSNSTKLIVFAASKLRIHFDIQVGEHPLDDFVIDAKDKVQDVTNRLEHLSGEIHHILRVQDYQREREEYYREKSEDTNSNVLWWAIIQTLILTSVGIWQIKRFKDFLIAKKVV